MRTPSILIACSLVLAPALPFVGCAPAKPTEPPKAAKPKLGPIDPPDDLVVEMLVRDPLLAAQNIGRAAGMPDGAVEQKLSKDLFDNAPSPLKEALQNLDLHGNLFSLTVGDVRKPDTYHFAVGARLKDAKKTAALFADAAKPGAKVTAWESDLTGTTCWDMSKVMITVVGDALVIADTRQALEGTARYVGREAAEGTPPHDLTVHMPLAKLAKAVSAEAKDDWAKAAADSTDMHAFDPSIGKLIEALGDLGDAQLFVDLDKDNVVVEAKLEAKASLSEWLGKYPVGTPTSLLTLPKASDAIVVRFPESINALFKEGLAGSSQAIATSNADAEEKEAFRALARSIGHEVAVVWTDFGKGAVGGPHGGFPAPREIMLRIELDDSKGATAAIKKLVALESKKPDRKLVRTPYNKYGADGETYSITDSSGKSELRWAVKPPHLYVDYALSGKTTLSDAAVDPGAKDTFRADPRAKLVADKIPKEGLVAAYYAQTSAAPALKELGAVPSLKGIRWAWLMASKAGIATQFNVPLSDAKSFNDTWLGSSAPPDASAAAAPSASAAPPSASAPSASASASAKPKK